MGPERMRLPRALQESVDVARFADRIGVDVYHACRIVQLARRVKRAVERLATRPSDRDDLRVVQMRQELDSYLGQWAAGWYPRYDGPWPYLLGPIGGTDPRTGKRRTSEVREVIPALGGQ